MSFARFSELFDYVGEAAAGGAARAVDTKTYILEPESGAKGKKTKQGEWTDMTIVVEVLRLPGSRMLTGTVNWLGQLIIIFHLWVCCDTTQ